MSTTEILFARLKATYPLVEFELVDSSEFADSSPDEAPPEKLIAFNIDGTIIIDPMVTSCGRFNVDPQEVYGISKGDAISISMHNETGVVRHLEEKPDGEIVCIAPTSERARMPFPTPELVAALANQFIEELHDTIGEANLAKVRMRNRIRPDDVACASHEFCDAHVCMLNAFCNIVGVKKGEFNTADADVAALWNPAWQLARACRFAMPYQLQFEANHSGMTLGYHTISFFAEGEEFGPHDLFAIHALSIGESYVISNPAYVLRVTRMQ